MAFVNQEKIFYGASAFLGILAILYFGFEYLVALTPFTISVILFAVFLGFLGAGLRTEGNSSVLSYIFSAGAYVIGLFYTISKFEFGSNGVQLSLVISSAIFAGLGYLVTQKEYQPEKEDLKKAAAVLLVFVGVLIVYDIASDPVRYDYSLTDEVEINDSMKVGEVTTEKTSLLPQESRGMNFHVCAYNSTGVPQGSTGFTSSVKTMKFGSFSQTNDILVEMDTEDLDIEGKVPVEEQENNFRCGESEDGPKLVVIQTSDDIPVIRTEH